MLHPPSQHQRDHQDQHPASRVLAGSTAGAWALGLVAVVLIGAASSQAARPPVDPPAPSQTPAASPRIVVSQPAAAAEWIEVAGNCAPTSTVVIARALDPESGIAGVTLFWGPPADPTSRATEMTRLDGPLRLSGYWRATIDAAGDLLPTGELVLTARARNAQGLTADSPPGQLRVARHFRC